jgi:hypothetical protein
MESVVGRLFRKIERKLNRCCVLMRSRIQGESWSIPDQITGWLLFLGLRGNVRLVQRSYS